MSPGSYIAVYFIVWWICLFAVLPFGARSQTDDGVVVRGTDPGAPTQTRLLRTVLWTTGLSLPLTMLLLWGLASPWLAQYLR